MLHQLIIIKSELYAKAKIRLGDTQSIQLVGQNNVGKSSLVNTLNFLYITEAGQMRFEGNRRLKDSLKHYFPTLHQSYILFEIKGQTTYCILVKRTPDNDIAHYHIPHAYDENLFFTTTKEGQQVRPFDELCQKMLTQGISYKALSRDELYHQVYSDERAQDPVLLLSKERRARKRGRSNTFARLYKHLIHSVKISADDLTDMLVDASHTDIKPLSIFAESGSTHLNDLERLEKKAAKLRQIKPQLTQLKEAQKLFNAQQQTLGQAHYSFSQRYPEAIQTLNSSLQEVRKKIDNQQQHLEQLNTQQATLLQEKGRCQSTLEHHQTALSKLQAQLDTIAPYSTQLSLSALQTEVAQLETHKQRLHQLLYGKNAQPKDTKTLKKELNQLEHACERLHNTIQHFSDTLIQHISPDTATRQQLNTILSKEALYLPKSAVKKQITKTKGDLTLFDGEIDVSSLKTQRPFTTVEELREELEEKQQSSRAIQQLLRNQEAYAEAKAQWEQRYHLLAQVLQKPTLLTQQKSTQKAIVQLEEKIKQYTSQLTTHHNVHQEAFKVLDQQKEKYQGIQATQNLFTSWRQELTHIHVPERTYDLLPEKDLRKLYERIQLSARELAVQAQQRDLPFHQLAKQVGEYKDDPEKFIESLEQQLTAMESLDNKRQAILEGVMNTFVNPTQTFLDRYHEFKSYVERFSKKLADHHISGIQHIELYLEEVPSLLEELQQISALQQRTPLELEANQQAQRMQLLRKYIAAERTIQMKDLFQLKLKLTKKEGQTTTLDISKQMESYGTDKVLRLFIFLMLLKAFFVAEPHNRVAVYIDEIGTVDPENIQRILTLCEQCQVLPIFASINLVEGFSKYYLLLPTPENQGKLCIDEQSLLLNIPQPDTSSH